MLALNIVKYSVILYNEINKYLPSDPYRGTTAHCPSVIVVSDALALAVCASRSARSPVARSAAPTIAKAPRATAMSVAIHRSLALLPLPPPV